MPDTPATSLSDAIRRANVGATKLITSADPAFPTDAALADALAEANLHHHRGDEYRRTAGTSHRPDYWLNRASIAYALASVITLGMKDEGHG